VGVEFCWKRLFYQAISHHRESKKGFVQQGETSGKGRLLENLFVSFRTGGLEKKTRHVTNASQKRWCRTRQKKATFFWEKKRVGKERSGSLRSQGGLRLPGRRPRQGLLRLRTGMQSFLGQRKREKGADRGGGSRHVDSAELTLKMVRRAREAVSNFPAREKGKRRSLYL